MKTCQMARHPKRPKSRLEMAVPAAQWEMVFTARLAELKKTEKQPQPVAAEMEHAA